MKIFAQPLRMAGIRFLVATCAIACVAAPSLAKNTPDNTKGQIVECRFTPAMGDTLPKQLFLGIDGDDIVVVDNVTEHFGITKQTARVDIDNPTRITYVWTVKNVKDRMNQPANLSYRLTIQKATLKASMSGRALGYENVYQSSGVCSGF